MFQACTSQTCTKLGSSLVIQSANCAISKNLSSSCRSLARIQRALEIRPRNPPRATVVKASTGGAFSRGWTRVRPSLRRSSFKDLWICDTPRRRAAANTSHRAFLNAPVMRWNEIRASEFSLCSLRGCQFPAREDDHAADTDQTAKEQDNLS